jgi:RNA polymerase sigma-70 factor, ECF subfamily
MPAATLSIHPWRGVRHTLPKRTPNAPAKLTCVSDALQDLVTRCRDGDSEAFRELFRAHRDDVARLVFRMSGSRADLDDLIQEVFLQVHRSIADFRGESRFSTWLYRLTVNVVLMHRRAAKSRPQLVADETASPLQDPRLLPDEQVARRRRVDAFQRVIDRLTEKKRTVFLLHEVEGLSPAEIAEIVKAPVLTVRTRLFYARREVLGWLAEEPSLSGIAAEVGAEPGHLATDAGREPAHLATDAGREPT